VKRRILLKVFFLLFFPLLSFLSLHLVEIKKQKMSFINKEMKEQKSMTTKKKTKQNK